MKRKVWIGELFVFFFVFTVWIWPVGAQTPTREVLEQLAVYPSLIVYNAKIYTMDTNVATYEAMAVRGSRIWRLGKNDAIRRLAGPQTEAIDAKGRAVVPGLIDSHTHLYGWAPAHHGAKYDPQFQYMYIEGKTPEEVKSRLGEAIQARIRQVGPDKWVLVSIPPALRAQSIVEGKIDKQYLDSIAPDTPVKLEGINPSLINTKGKKELARLTGVGNENVERIFSIDPQTNTFNDVRLLYVMPYDVILKGKTKEAADLLYEELSEQLRLGVTTVSSHIESPQALRSLNYLDRQGRMPIRWAWVHRSGFLLGNDPAEFYRILGDFSGQGSEFLWNIGVGHEGWDNNCGTTAVPRNRGAPLDEVYRVDKSRCQIYPGTRGYDGLLAATRSGIRMSNVHATTDTVLDAAFHLADQLIKEGSITLEEIREQHWSFDHGFMVRPDQAANTAKYGFWMVFQARNIGIWEDVILHNYGAKYLSWNSPAKAWLDADARFTLSTDGHVDFQDEKEHDSWLVPGSVWPKDWPDQWRGTIWPNLGVWVTGEINGKVYNPQNKLDRTTVMKAWTIWPAEMVLREKDLGSLEVGKLADFIVIDKDYFTIAEAEINNIKTLLTAIDGQIKYKVPSF